MSKSSIITSQIYKSRKTLLDQLNYIGYDTDEYAAFSINEIIVLLENKQLDMLLEKPTSQKIFVKYNLFYILKPAIIQLYVDELFNLEEILQKTDTLLIIVKEDINETIQIFLKHIWETQGILVVIQSLPRLQYNILNHTLVPPHHIIEDKEQINFIKTKYNIVTDSQFPKLHRFDAVSIVLCSRPGDIIEIDRPSKTSITSKYYRICVNDR